MEDCIFCKIVKQDMKAEIIHEDAEIIAFKDINPKAPVHVLIVPKIHIVSINHLKEENKALVGQLFLNAKKVAEKVGVKETGYKLVFNVGEGGGQLVNHLHLHLLGGWRHAKERDVPGMP